MTWRMRGSYVESCNCDAICPCRRVDGEAGGRSTHGICMGVLSWLVDEGAVGEVDVSGLAVAIAMRYDDDEPGSPWTWTLYLDERATAAQHAALADVFSGRLGGDPLIQFPWARKPSTLLAVRSVPIEVDHRPRRQRLRIRDLVEVRIGRAHGAEAVVTCMIPGHHRAGEELVADRLAVHDGALDLELAEVCGYAASFEYRG